MKRGHRKRWKDCRQLLTVLWIGILHEGAEPQKKKEGRIRRTFSYSGLGGGKGVGCPLPTFFFRFSFLMFFFLSFSFRCNYGEEDRTEGKV